MISVVIGRQGSGKTLYLVGKAKRYYEMGKRVVSNIKLSFPYEKIDYYKVVRCEYENAVVIIDEAHQLISSRACMQTVNRMIVERFITMCRKKRVHAFFSTQFLRQVDVRVRDHADFYVMCKKYGVTDEGIVPLIGDELVDPKKVKVVIECEIEERVHLDVCKEFFVANKLFKLYDTQEIIDIKKPSKEELKDIESDKPIPKPLA